MSIEPGIVLKRIPMNQMRKQQPLLSNPYVSYARASTAVLLLSRRRFCRNNRDNESAGKLPHPRKYYVHYVTTEEPRSRAITKFSTTLLGRLIFQFLRAIATQKIEHHPCEYPIPARLLWNPAAVSAIGRNKKNNNELFEISGRTPYTSSRKQKRII